VIENIRRHPNLLVVCCGLAGLLGYFAWQQPMVMSPFGLRSIANQGTAAAIAAVGQLTVILVGGIDLSIGPVIALCNCFAATLFPVALLAPWIVCVAAVLIGALCGLINGCIVILLRVQPIIVTLATGYIFTGISLYVRPSPGGSAPEALHRLLTGSSGYLPHALVMVVALVALVWWPLTRTRVGQGLYAVGGNEPAAFLSGLPVRRIKLFSYTLGGGMAGMAGLFLTAQTSSGDARIGAVYTLGSIAAAVLGGATLSGGRGNAAGAVVAAFLISVLLGVLFASGISTFYQSILEGGVLMVVLAIGAARYLRAPDWLVMIRAE
jgi:ribose transport system permease protein